MSALEDMIESHHTEVSLLRKANRQMYEEALEELAGIEHCPAQMVEDAVLHVSIECMTKPSDIVEPVLNFLRALVHLQHTEEEAPP